jgi:hypothetical protein
MEFANSQLNSEIQERIAAAGKNLNNHVTDTAAAGPVGSSLV